MIKLIKFLKPFIALILLTIILLFGQAMAELALPDYMSRIVNNGIQQSGIENAIPEIIIAGDYQQFQLSMTLDEIAEVNSIYLRVEPKNDEYSEYEVEANGQALYILNEEADFTMSEIEPVMVKALMENSGTQMGTMSEGTMTQVGAKALSEYYTSIGVNVQKTQRDYILGIGAVMIFITVLGAIASISVGFLASRIAAGVGRNLRKTIFTKIEGFSNQEFDKFSTASLITRSTNDVTQIQSLLVMLLRIIFFAPIMGIGGVFKALEKSTSMSWIIALAVIVLIGMIMVVFSIALPKFKLVQKLIDRLNMVTRENLAGMMVIRAFNTQIFEENRFDEANRELTKTNLFVNRVMVFLHPAMMLIMNGTSLLIIWVGAHQIANSAMQVGDMMAYMQYALQIIFAFLMLSMMFIMIPRAIVSAQRITEVLDTQPTILDPVNPLNRIEMEWEKLFIKM
jgi:ATP-binding cassette subfamily B protein